MDTKFSYTQRNKVRGAREVLQQLFDYHPFTKKQKKLLLALTSFKPTPVSQLEQKTKSISIKALIRDTNKRIERNHLEDKIIIVSCYATSGLKGYYRLLFSPFVTE